MMKKLTMLMMIMAVGTLLVGCGENTKYVDKNVTVVEYVDRNVTVTEYVDRNVTVVEYVECNATTDDNVTAEIGYTLDEDTLMVSFITTSTIDGTFLLEHQSNEYVVWLDVVTVEQSNLTKGSVVVRLEDVSVDTWHSFRLLYVGNDIVEVKGFSVLQRARVEEGEE